MGMLITAAGGFISHYFGFRIGLHVIAFATAGRGRCNAWGSVGGAKRSILTTAIVARSW
jgi:hypothetical protein